MMYTHHQKQVIADTPDNELVAMVGGVSVRLHFVCDLNIRGFPLSRFSASCLSLQIDLTYGRFDNNDYPLFRTLETIHRDDFHNACSDVLAKNGPRQPWHDIHARIQGPGTLDLIQNFEERWIGQGRTKEELF